MGKPKRSQALSEMQMRQRILQERSSGRAIQKGRLPTLRSTLANGTGWGQRDLDALIARMAEDGEISLPKEGHSLATRAQRLEAMAVAAQGEAGEMMRRVRRWLRTNTDPLQDGRLEVRAGMLNRMLAGLKRKSRYTPNTCALAIKAAVALLTAQGEVRVEARVEGKGASKQSEWQADSLAWAAQHSWISSDSALKPCPKPCSGRGNTLHSCSHSHQPCWS